MRSLLLILAVLTGTPLTAGPLQDLARLQQDTNAARLEAVRQLLMERGIAFEARPFEGGGVNLVASFGPAGPREIVVGAHFDAVKLKDGSLSRGMVDNGAGVIAAAGLAQALKGRTLRHRVQVVFFDQEELGLLGSKAYVAKLQPADVAAAVNVDIVGYGETLLFGGGKEPGSTPVYRALQRVCAERRLGCLEFPAFPTGDDRSFEAVGIPNVSVAFLPAVEAHQLWLLLNGGDSEVSGLRPGLAPPILKTIHTSGDTLDKVEEATLERASSLLLDLVTELDAALDPAPSGGSAKPKAP